MKRAEWPRLAAVVLAAGRSRRMGAPDKLLLPVRGMAMIERVVAVAAEVADEVVVVVGPDCVGVRAALAGRPVGFAVNPDPARGISGSLAVGLSALGSAVGAAFVCLGDMPQVGSVELRRLAAALPAVAGNAVCVPTYDGRRGNPVLWGCAHFGELAELDGDVGGRTLFARLEDQILEVPMPSPGVLLDVDTPAAWQALRTKGGVAPSTRPAN